LEATSVEFVWMRRDGIEKPARIPVSAVPHWEGRGWERTEPPARPERRTRNAPAEPVDQSTPVDAKQDTEDKTPVKTRKAPSGRKED
jgi:hypothetical protein